MKITLMNKNTPLMSLDIDIKTSYVKEILKIHNAEPMPISVYSDDETTLGENFTQWWNGRSIPASRRQLRERLQEALEPEEPIRRRRHSDQGGF